MLVVVVVVVLLVAAACSCSCSGSCVVLLDALARGIILVLLLDITGKLLRFSVSERCVQKALTRRLAKRLRKVRKTYSGGSQNLF